jgi:hypothetical protein
MTVAELQSEAIRRASILNLAVPGGDFHVRLDAEDGPIAFPEDAVVDVVGMNETGTVWLVSTSNGTVRNPSKVLLLQFD